MDKIEGIRKNRDTLQQAFDSDFEKANAIIEKETPTKFDYSKAEACLEVMKEKFDKGLALNEEIEKLCIKNKDDEITKTEILETNERNIESRTKLIHIKKFVDSRNQPKVSPITSVTIKDIKTAQLPKLKLPTFDGTFTQWSAFWDTITADVINGQYADITKFNYIKGQLQGAALDAVIGIHNSGDNLTTLTNILKERFGQPRKIIRAHVGNILDLPPAVNNFNSLNTLYNRIMGDIRSLENLNVNVEECAAVLVPIIERKLPKPVRERMGTSGQGDHFRLRKFVESLREQLENLGERVECDIQSKDNDRNTNSNHRNTNFTRSSVDSFVSMPTAKSPAMRISTKLVPAGTRVAHVIEGITQVFMIISVNTKDPSQVRAPRALLRQRDKLSIFLQKWRIHLTKHEKQEYKKPRISPSNQ
jgi:hypothetical protein